MPDIHIIPDGDRRNVKQENASVVSTHETQAEAEQAGKSWLRDNRETWPRRGHRP